MSLKYLHEVNTTVKLRLVPDFSIQVLLVSHPVTATERTFPYTEPGTANKNLIVMTYG